MILYYICYFNYLLIYLLNYLDQDLLQMLHAMIVQAVRSREKNISQDLPVSTITAQYSSFGNLNLSHSLYQQ